MTPPALLAAWRAMSPGAAWRRLRAARRAPETAPLEPPAAPPPPPAAWPSIDGAALEEVTRRPFRPKAPRAAVPPLLYVFTTERCELACVMCHFNGPNAVRKFAELDPALVRKLLEGRPPGDPVWFVATGDFLNDPNALEHLRTARALGLAPRVITHGQRLTPALMDEILAIGVREILLSIDSIDPDRYAKIRVGARLDVLLDACAYLRAQKRERYPDLRVGVTVISFARQPTDRPTVEAFWRSRVDYVQFVSENYDLTRFRRIFFVPEQRTDCRLELLTLPTGRIAPCCAMTVYAHDSDVSWLPHVADTSPAEAYRKLNDLYEDPDSPLGRICKRCNWWVQFHTNERGHSPIYERVDFA